MSVFDGVTQALLRDAPGGGKILSLWGRPVRRFLLAPADVAALTRVETWFYISFMLLLVVGLRLVSWSYLVGIGVPVAIAIHLVILELFARRLPQTHDAPVAITVAEAQARYAKATGKRLLVFCLLTSIMFISVGIWLIAKHNWFGWLPILFFGYCMLTFVRLLRRLRD